MTRRSPPRRRGPARRPAAEARPSLSVMSWYLALAQSHDVAVKVTTAVGVFSGRVRRRFIREDGGLSIELDAGAVFAMDDVQQVESIR